MEPRVRKIGCSGKGEHKLIALLMVKQSRLPRFAHDPRHLHTHHPRGNLVLVLRKLLLHLLPESSLRDGFVSLALLRLQSQLFLALGLSVWDES